MTKAICSRVKYMFVRQVGIKQRKYWLHALVNVLYYINCSVLQGFLPPRNAVSEHT